MSTRFWNEPDRGYRYGKHSTAQTSFDDGPGNQAAICAAYLPLALWSGHTYVPIEKPQGQMVQPIGEIMHIEGFAYRAPAPFLLTYADNDPGNQRSPIVLYENLTPLGPPHSAHQDIQEIGRGRYSHWNDNNPKSGWRSINGVLFSASDNSDPRTNGRHYWAGLPRQAVLQREMR